MYPSTTIPSTDDRLKKKHIENLEYFNSLDSLIANDTNVHRILNPELTWQKQRSTRIISAPANRTLFLRTKAANCFIWIIDLYGAETWTLRTADQKCLQIYVLKCCAKDGRRRSVCPIV
jgi:hypothetical protein